MRGNENLSSLKELVRLKEAGTSVDVTLPKPVNIPDANLATAVQTALDALPTLTLQPDDPIFPEDIVQLTTLNAPSQNIETLTGLDKATAPNKFDALEQSNCESDTPVEIGGPCVAGSIGE